MATSSSLPGASTRSPRSIGRPVGSSGGGDGSLALELTTRGRLWIYRAVRHEWRTTLFTTTPQNLHFGIIDAGDSAVLRLSIRNDSAADLTFDCIQITNPYFATDVSLPMTLSPGESQGIEMTFSPPDAREYTGKLYVRTSSEKKIVPQM